MASDDKLEPPNEVHAEDPVADQAGMPLQQLHVQPLEC